MATSKHGRPSEAKVVSDTVFVDNVDKKVGEDKLGADHTNNVTLR